MTKLTEELREANEKGIGPPQNWTSRAIEEIESRIDPRELCSLSFDGHLVIEWSVEDLTDDIETIIDMGRENISGRLGELVNESYVEDELVSLFVNKCKDPCIQMAREFIRRSKQDGMG